MKKITYGILSLLLISITDMNAQIAIGADSEPHSGSILDLQSTIKGLLLPKISLENVDVFQLSADGDTAEGMIIYNINADIVGGNGEGIYVWDGTKWILI